LLAFVRETSVMMVDGQPAAATATIENVSAEGDAAPGSAPSPRRSSRAASAKKEEKTKETEAVPTAAEAEEETKDGEKGEDAEVEAVSKVKYKEDRSVFKPERVFVPPAMSRSGRAVKMSARAQEAKQHADEAEAKAQAPAPSPRSKSKPTRLEEDEEDEGDEGEEGEEDEEGKKRKKARRSGSGAAEVDSPEPQPVEMKRKLVTTTLSRLEGSFGFALDGNYVSAVHEGGAAALNGNIKVGDWILEVNGKDTAISGFAPLLPKSREAPIRLKLARLVTLEEASMEAEEKAMAKLAEATDAPELPEGATSSATEARRRLFASAVSAATKAGLDKEAIKVVQVKLARLPPPPPKPEVTYRDPFELPPMPAPGT
jgi:hypothetical protein